MKNRIFLAIWIPTIFYLPFVLIGCGERGGGGSDEIFSPIQGIFVDSTVEGLQYATRTHSGLTDAQGTFQCIEGQKITFSIGDIVLGQTLAKGIITPVDLVKGALKEKNPTVTNIARFLLSLDLDGYWNNGIFISDEVQNECLGRVINFNQTIADFEDDPAVKDLLDTLNSIGAFDDIRALYPASNAQSHLINTINNYCNRSQSKNLSIKKVLSY